MRCSVTSSPISAKSACRDTVHLVALEDGMVTSYALRELQQRGAFFVQPGDEVYAGQVVGQHIRDEDLVVNVCKTEAAWATTAPSPSRTWRAWSLPRILSLDDAIEYLGDDDLLEVTPSALRIRKKELRHDIRQRAAKRAANGIE